MFTGIVNHQGILLNVEHYTDKLLLSIQSQFKEFELGASIAVDGVCLTVTAFSEQQFVVEVSPETLALTVASSYKPGMQVNLEKPLCIGDEIGGHVVTGHVDQVATCIAKQQVGEFIQLDFNGIDDANFTYLVKKGSVAINGVSLTVNDVISNNTFSIMLIPHTLTRTTLNNIIIGSKVNIEFDQTAKMIQNHVKHYLMREVDAYAA